MEDQPPEQTEQPQPTRMSPQEVFTKYGIATVLLAAWTAWCIRDGWFRDWEHSLFNKTLAVPSAIAFLYCLVMAASAASTLWRRKNHPPPPGP